MANPDRRRALPSELGVAALVVAASIPLGRLFRTGSIFSTTLAAAAVSAAIAFGLRRLRAPTLVSAAASLAAFCWFASLAFFRHTMLGPFPTPDSMAHLWDAFVVAIRRSQTDAAPVAVSVPFKCLCSFAVWATAWLADDAAIKLRHPMLAIGVTVPLYVLPGTIVVGTNRWADAGVYLAAALWVLFQDERFRLSRWGRVVGTGVPGWRPGLAARMGIAAIALALIATPMLPGFGAPPGLRGATGGNRTTLNPFVSIIPKVGSPNEVEVFTVRTRFSTYWRLTALDVFDGVSWKSSPQSPSLRMSKRTISPETQVASTLVRQDVEIRSLAGPWMPAAYEPVRVDGIKGVGADPASRTLIAPDDLRRGLKYTIRSRVPQLTYEELDAVPPTLDPSLARYVALSPGPEVEQVAEIAHRVVSQAHADSTRPFRQAVALQNYLRTFTYDLDAGLTHHHTINEIVDFLENSRRGYCEQFATAMAVMARTLGLPARVAVGFAGGNAGPTPDEFVVTTRNAHAWVEINFAGYGWVSFEPTPRSDSVVVPTYTRETTITTPATPTAEPTVSAEPTPSSSSASRVGPDLEVSSNGGNRVIKTLLWIGLVVVGLALVVALVFPVAAAVRRAVRRRRAHEAHELVAVRYLDFLDWCAATGRGRSSGETPLEHSRRLAEASTDAEPSLTALATIASDAVYAPGNGIDVAGATRLGREARRGVEDTLPRRTRVMARLGWGWWRTDPASRAKSLPTPAERIRTR
jgi:transglutaminase-like putative cysteine protease